MYFATEFGTSKTKQNSVVLLNNLDISTEKFYFAKMLLLFRLKTAGTENLGQN